MGTGLNKNEVDFAIKRVRENHSFYQNQIKNVLNLIKIKKGDEILDIGCCSGKYEAIISHTCKITGIDIDAYAVKKANEYCKEKGKDGNWKVLLKTTTLSKMFKSKQFTKIMMIDFTEHCKDKELEKMFNELKEVCAENAELLIYTPNKFHWTSLIPNHLPGHINLKTGNGLKRFVEKQGWVIKELYFEGKKLPLFKKRLCLKAVVK